MTKEVLLNYAKAYVAALPLSAVKSLPWLDKMEKAVTEFLNDTDWYCTEYPENKGPQVTFISQDEHNCVRATWVADTMIQEVTQL